jgi:hypothetical protein
VSEKDTRTADCDDSQQQGSGSANTHVVFRPSFFFRKKARVGEGDTGRVGLVD